MSRDTDDVYSPGRQLDEEQHVQGREPDRLDGEEVAGEDPLGLGAEELRPCWTGASGRRPEAVCSEQGSDRGGPDPDPELAELAFGS